MRTGKDDLKAVMTGDRDFTSREEQKNYEALKSMLISAMRKREGKFEIDYRECADLACDVARQLPDGVKIMGNHEQKEPSWLIPIVIIAVCISLLVFYLAIMNQIPQL